MARIDLSRQISIVSFNRKNSYWAKRPEIPNYNKTILKAMICLAHPADSLLKTAGFLKKGTVGIPLGLFFLYFLHLPTLGQLLFGVLCWGH